MNSLRGFFLGRIGYVQLLIIFYNGNCILDLVLVTATVSSYMDVSMPIPGYVSTKQLKAWKLNNVLTILNNMSLNKAFLYKRYF